MRGAPELPPEELVVEEGVVEVAVAEVVVAGEAGVRCKNRFVYE